MAPKVIDYSKSVIYKIEHVDNPELLYVGSTTDFIRRKSQHKRDCNNIKSKEFNKKLYQMIRCNGGIDNFKCIVIKEYICNSKIELLIEEEKHRKELQANLNSIKAFRSIEEEKEYKKEYYQINKEHKKDYSQEYYQINKEHKKDYSQEYYQINKEHKKDYYQEHKKQILQKLKEKITCSCGSVFNKGDKSKHYKTLKHINFINN